MAAQSTAQLVKKAQKLFDEGKFQEIVNLLNDEVLEKHNSALLFTKRARAHDRLKNAELAIKFAELAIQIDDSLPEAFLALGDGLALNGKLDKSIAVIDKAISMNPSFDVAYNNRGIVWSQKGELGKALTDYDKAVSLNPNYALAYLNRGQVFYKRGELDKAYAEYDKTISLDPKNSTAYVGKGTILYDKGEFDKSQVEFDTAVSLELKNSYAHNGRGNAFRAKGEFDKARDAYLEAIFFSPNEPIYHGNLGKLLQFDIDDGLQALEHYNKAIELAKDEKLRNDYIYFRDTILEEQEEEQESEELIDEKDELEQHFDDIDSEVDNILRLAKYIQGEPVVHYTKLSVADKLIDKDANLRYYNVLYMNDPSEGDVLFDCFSKDESLNIKEAFERGKKQVETSVYLGSFLINMEEEPHEDELVMWRTYGKDQNGNEAAGCSLVIDSDFFDKEDATPVRAMERETQVLYEVVYFKNGKYSIDKIKSCIKHIEKSLKELLRKRNKENGRIIDKRIFTALSEISHLIKSADYSYEHEVRIVQYMPLGTPLIKVDEMVENGQSPKLYIESNKSILAHINKVFVGPKAHRPDNWMAYLDYKVRRKRTEDDKRYPLKLYRSQCRFQ